MMNEDEVREKRIKEIKESITSLYEIAYRFKLKGMKLNERIVFEDGDDGSRYELAQVIAKDEIEARKYIEEMYHISREILEVKLLKVTEITSCFMVHSTSIPEQIYNQLTLVAEELTRLCNKSSSAQMKILQSMIALGKSLDEN